MLSPRVQLIGMEVEALVGLWLVSGYARRGAWVAGITLFAILAAVSLYLAAVGQASCGCFGRVEVSPWLSFSLDSVCVVAMAAFRPVRMNESFSRTGLAPAGLVCGFAVLAGVVMTTPTVEHRMAKWNGTEVLLAQKEADAGTGEQGTTGTVIVEILNQSDREIRLIGGSYSCSCVATDDLPAVVAPKSILTLSIRLTFTGDPGTFKHNFELYTDSPSQPRLSGRIAGRVVGKAGT